MGDLDTAIEAAAQAVFRDLPADNPAWSELPEHDRDTWITDTATALTAALSALRAEGWEIVKLVDVGKVWTAPTEREPMYRVSERLDTTETPPDAKEHQ